MHAIFPRFTNCSETTTKLIEDMFSAMNTMMRMKFGQLACAAFSRFNNADHGHNSLFTFKTPSALHHHHKPPINITVGSPSSSIRPFTTTYTSLAAATTAAAGRENFNTFVRRPKREDFKHTEFDYAFSEWKILIGPLDWKEHAMGKEGVERYRTHNLPKCACSPGVYELAVSVVLRRNSGIIMLIPVYVGQTDNIRSRLQDYGRNGAHLESNGRLLVSDVLSRGFSIVYRWARMKNKEEAEKTEGEMLNTYDYAWNKRNNGDRRPDDVCRILHVFKRLNWNIEQRTTNYEFKSTNCK